MASLHDRRAHEQRNVNVNSLIVQQTSHASHRALRARWGWWSQLTDEQDGAIGSV